MRLRYRMPGLAGPIALALSLAAVAPPAWAEAAPAAPPPAAGTPGPAVPLPPPAAPAPAILGFRSAHFGMTETEVRTAIADDFHLPPAAIHSSQNPVERTAVLMVRVTDLAPGTGGAIVSYVFGYQSHTLIEVNVVWSKVSDARLTPEQLAVIGARLQAYFAGEGFPPADTAMNVALPDGVLLFRTSDAAGRAIALILSGQVRNDAKTAKRVLTPSALSLAYAADAPHPDVFRLEKGSF